MYCTCSSYMCIQYTRVQDYLLKCILILWTHVYVGMCKAEYELCLDCRWPTAQNLFRHQCLTGRHKPAVVVYRDDEAKELVTVRYPENMRGMLDRKYDYHVRHYAAECHRGKECSFPHTQVEARIWNQYKSAVGPPSTALPPTKVRRYIL